MLTLCMIMCIELFPFTLSPSQPLSEEKALAAGADVFSELFVYSVAAVCYVRPRRTLGCLHPIAFYTWATGVAALTNHPACQSQAVLVSEYSRSSKKEKEKERVLMEHFDSLSAVCCSRHGSL